MPAESIAPMLPPPTPSGGNGLIKCSHCGGSGLLSTRPISLEADEIGDDDAIDRVCAACWTIEEDGEDRLQRDLTTVQRGREEVDSLGLGLRGMSLDSNREEPSAEETRPSPSPPTYAEPLLIPSPPPAPSPTSHPHSLPSQHTRPWSSQPIGVSPISEERPRPEANRPYNPLLDFTNSRMNNTGRGALYPGSVFKGTQTSGRSAYDVEIRFIDTNFPESTVSGYLSISHLTDTHPHLTTFFTGEIIGPKYGFITGSRFGATEHDDMRHWGRFEQFRRPATRADMIRPDLLFRDPVGRPTTTVAMGGIGVGRDKEKGQERDFVFLRIKERFLVPDHTVRDISGASFAGFYFAMIDLNPTAASEAPMSPASPTIPKSPPLPTSPLPQYAPLVPSAPPPAQRRQSTGPTGYVQPPPNPRRMSSSGPRTPGVDVSPIAAGGRRRRESSRVEREPQREATMRGYYFHSLNQEPFQELFLTHVPTRSSGAFEMR